MAVRKLFVPYAIQNPATPLNLFDGTDFPDLTLYASRWSPGATIITGIPLSPTHSQVWDVLSIAITGYIVYNQSHGSHFGKLGKLVGGLLLNPASPPQVPATSPMLPLPDDASLVFDLWNPDANPMPPSISNPVGSLPGFGGLPFSGVLSLPTPIEARGDDLPTLAVGMWLQPMLLGRATTEGFIGTTFTIVVSGAKVAVTYDDKGY
jgi:hypothetical protein